MLIHSFFLESPISWLREVPRTHTHDNLCPISCGQVQTIVKVPHEGTPLERLLQDNSTQWFNFGQRFFATSWVWESLNVRPLDSQNLEMLSCVKVPHTKGTFICSTRVMVNVVLRRKCLWGSCGCVQQTTYAQRSRKDRKGDFRGYEL